MRRRQRPILGALLREVKRKMAYLAKKVQTTATLSLGGAKGKNKVYAPHAPKVYGIGMGKACKPFEFGANVSLVITHKQGLVI